MSGLVAPDPNTQVGIVHYLPARPQSCAGEPFCAPNGECDCWDREQQRQARLTGGPPFEEDDTAALRGIVNGLAMMAGLVAVLAFAWMVVS